MPWVCFEQLEIFVGKIADDSRELLVMQPEFRSSEVIHFARRLGLFPRERQHSDHANCLKWFAASCLEIRFGALPGGVKTSSKDVSFDLTIPLVRDILLKPLRQIGKLVRRKLAHRFLDFLHAHGERMRQKRRGGNPIGEPHAPRMRETSGRLRMRARNSSVGSVRIWSTVTARLRSKRPDCVRRSSFKCAPQPSSPPISCAYVRT